MSISNCLLIISLILALTTSGSNGLLTLSRNKCSRIAAITHGNHQRGHSLSRCNLLSSTDDVDHISNVPEDPPTIATFFPFQEQSYGQQDSKSMDENTGHPYSLLALTVFVISLTGIATIFAPSIVNAIPFSSSFSAAADSISLQSFNSGIFDPATFQPVCPASDSFYQLAKSLASSLIGSDNVAEYGPLIASVLLRVRLELCVFESFLYEAVVPFVRQKGLSWILPLHETLETFIAGTVFAAASNFILLGSTKIFTVLLIYFDALFGWPIRLVGSLLQRFAQKTSAPHTAGKLLQLLGDIVGTIRRSVEVIDTFVGRYLVFATTVYILFKFAHFKFFNYW